MIDSSTILMELQEPHCSWSASNAEVKEVEFRELFRVAKQSTDDNCAHLVELLCLIARAQNQQLNFSGSRVSLEEAEKLLTEPECTAITRIQWLLEMGRLFIFEKTPARARGLFKEAWGLSVELGDDYFTADIARMMAVIEPQKAQEEWLQKAIQIAEESTQQKTKHLLGALYTAIAWKFFDLRQYEKAVNTFEKTIQHLKKYGSEQEIFIAERSMGKVLRIQGNLEKALLVQQNLLSKLSASDVKDGRLFEELGECFLALKRAEEAQTYFELAYKELSSDKWIADKHPLKLKRLKELGKVV